MSVLHEIFAHKKIEVAEHQRERPFAEMRIAAESAPPALDFIAALRQPPHPALIAEIKRASPSKGLLLADFDPLRLARLYAQNGARAISVLTDERYFQGSLDYLAQVRQQHPDMPLLRKDFIFDPYQVYEARAAGADALLLIAAALEAPLLDALQALAAELGMAALVEVHSLAELEAVMPLRPSLVGVNNRDLNTFQVSLDTTIKLRSYIPSQVTLVAESGIHSAEDVTYLNGIDPDKDHQARIQAILVGEALVTAPDIGARVRELAGVDLVSEPFGRKRKFCEG